MMDCGPGIIWSAMPVELIVEGMGPESPAITELIVDGRVLQVSPLGDGTATLVRLISGDPTDYLDPRFQPGNRIALRS